LLNETFLRLLRSGVFQNSPNKRYLFAAAARTMRNVIADHLRNKRARKRRGTGRRVLLEQLLEQLAEQPFEFGELNEAIERLESTSPRRASIVNMRFFLAMTIKETADALGVSTATVEKEWREARAWLFKQLS